MSLKNHKSPGVDEITNEQLKYGGSGLIDRLENLFKKVWESENVPEDWVKGIVVIVPKKGDTSYCSNNRGITLRSTASKLYQIIILRRMNAGLEQLLRENQCGFRPEQSIHLLNPYLLKFSIKLQAFDVVLTLLPSILTLLVFCCVPEDGRQEGAKGGKTGSPSQ